MPWELLLLPPVEQFLVGLDEVEYRVVEATLRVLEEFGPNLGTPKVKLILASRHKNMKELRCSSQGKIFRLLFAFDPKRRAVVLVGGDKSEIGFDDFYTTNVPIADDLFSEHCDALQKVEAAKAKKRPPNKAKGGRRNK